MENLEIFSNEEFGEVRTILNEEEVYFCGIDVCRVLGYKNGRDALRQHCRHDVVKYDAVDSLGRTQKISYIHQNDVLRLIVKSKLPAAEKFESWVFDEVVPSVLKHGAYATETTIENIINNPDFGIELLTKLKEEQEKRKEAELVIKHQKNEISEKDHIIEVQQPKAEFYDFAMDKESTYTATEIAKSLGFRCAAELNMFLKRKGVQYKKGGQWLLKAEYADKGYKKIRAYKNCNRGHQVWTLKGYEFIKNLYEEQIEKYRKGGLGKNARKI